MPTGGGGGGGGLSTVATNATLTGNGTSGSHLGVAGWPLANYVNGVASSTTALGTANTLWVESFNLPYAVTFAHIQVNIGTTDAVGLYDVGVYTFAGALVANIGAQTLPSTAEHNFATVQGSQTILPGTYFFAFTGNGTTATLGFWNNIEAFYSSRSTGVSSGGALPASFTPPAAAVDRIQWYFVLN